MKNADEATNPLKGITVLTEPSADLLNERQQIDYRNQRKQCLEWLLVYRKDPKRADGYAQTTVSNRAHRMDQFYRWVWAQENGYTTSVTHEHADAYLRHLTKQEHSNAHKDNWKKAVQMLFKWREHKHGLDEWHTELTFNTGQETSTPRDYLTRDERSKIREAAREYGSVPAYKGLDPEARDKWKAYLAQRFDKPKFEVTPEDWQRANDPTRSPGVCYCHRRTRRRHGWPSPRNRLGRCR